MIERMKNNKFWRGLVKYVQTLKGMTFREKVAHTWFSYKMELCVVAMGMFVVATVISCVITANTNLLLAGDVMNVEMTDLGMDYVSDQYFASLGVPSFMNKVQVVKTAYSTDEVDDYQYNYNVSNQTCALVAARRLDFQIINLPAMEMFFSPRSTSPASAASSFSSITIASCYQYSNGRSSFCEYFFEKDLFFFECLCYYNRNHKDTEGESLCPEPATRQN